MTVCERTSTFPAAIVATLLVAGALGFVPGNAPASEEAATTSENYGSADIRVTNARLSGEFSNRPLIQVLETISSQASFEYRVDKALSDYPVSGKFNAVPLIDTVRKILEPFNYVIVSKTNGEIRRLHIVGFRGASLESLPPEPRLRTETRRPALEVGDEPDTSENLDPKTAEYLSVLTPEERLAFEVADEKLGPPPELLDYFEPLPEPGSAETGPRAPPRMALQDLPEFDPSVSDARPTANETEND